MCNSSQGVEVKLTRFSHIQVHLVLEFDIFYVFFFFFINLTGIPVLRKHFKVQLIIIIFNNPKDLEETFQSDAS